MVLVWHGGLYIVRIERLVTGQLNLCQEMVVKEGQVSMHGPIKPRPGTGLLARVIHHVDGKLHERMIRRAYFRAAPAAAALRTMVDCLPQNSSDQDPRPMGRV
jgi:hypothetical protein